MAEPIPFKQVNLNMVPGEGHDRDQVHDLPVCRVDHGDRGHEVISCWRFTKPELEEIARTGVVWLRIIGPSTPPQCVQAFTPFD